MKENKYDNPQFFEQYSRMERSKKGLQGAGEWETLKKMLPDFKGKRVLDLGCGFGWHCRYAVENGAIEAIGIDISEKMLYVANEINKLPEIKYIQMPVEDIDFPDNSFDIVISSLTFHYIESFEKICRKIKNILTSGGDFVFSVEHPIFTSYGNQDWIYDQEGKPAYFPVDNYFYEGKREAVFLGEKVIKYHKTLTTYMNDLLKNGFTIQQVIEPQPTEKMLNEIPEMKNELRRPMMLLISAVKN